MADATAEYRDLLVAEETVASADRALRLVARVASGDGRGGARPWQHLITAPATLGRTGRASATMSARVSHVSWALDKVAAEARRRADEIGDGQYALLFDSLLLVFHHAYFAVLEGAGPRRSSLLASFDRFAAHMPRAADQNQIRGLVALARDDAEGAATAFRAALAATHSDEHDFITRLQLLWSLLMEHRRYRDAFACLLDVYPRVARADLDEVRGMLTSTFDESGRTTQRPLAS
jgi:hypothetical protein